MKDINLVGKKLNKKADKNKLSNFISTKIFDVRKKYRRKKTRLEGSNYL